MKLADVGLKALVAEVRRQAALTPHRVYLKPEGAARCSYLTSKDTPGCGCIIGEALLALGVEREELEQHEGHSVSVLFRYDDLTYRQRSPEQGWLTFVQNEQDIEKSWILAVEYADGLWKPVAA